MIIRVDYENDQPDKFWDALELAVAYDFGEPYDSCRQLIHATDWLKVSDELGAKVRAFVSALPGWNDPSAPEMAPNPLLFIDSPCSDDPW